MNEINEIKINSIPKLNVSQIGNFKSCPLRTALSYSSNIKIFPANPDAILGIVMHKMLEHSRNISNEIKFEKEWQKILDKQFLINQEIDSANFDWLCKYYYPKKNIVKKIVLETKISLDEQDIDSYKNLEEPLSDVLISGYADYYEEINDKLIIKDYKTGNIYEKRIPNDLTIKVDYVDQVKLYAGIAILKKPYLKKVQLSIQNASGKKFFVESSIENCKTLIIETKIKLKKVNKLIQQGNYKKLAKINKGCKFCNYRVFCPNFDKFLIQGVNGQIFDLVGKIIDYIITTKGIEIILEKINKEKVKIHNVDSKILCKIDKIKAISKNIIIFNLYKNKFNNEFYATSKSTIFKYNLI